MLTKLHNPLVALHEVTLGLLAKESSEDLLNTILDQAIEFTHADSGSIALLDDSRKYLDIKVIRGLDKDVKDKVKLRVGEGVTGRCILTGKAKLVSDTSKDPHYIEVKKEIRSELAVPLSVGSKSFGVISVDSSKLNAFHEEHVEYVELLASYAAMAFTNKQAIESFKHRTEIQETLIEISSILGKYPRVEEVFAEIMQSLELKIGLNRAAIFMYDPLHKVLNLVTSINYSEEQKQNLIFRPKEGLTGLVFTQEKFIAIEDISTDTRFINKLKRDVSGRKCSFFAAPIKLNNETKGVFSMELPYFSQSYFEDYSFLNQMLGSLFSQAIAIQNLIDESKLDVQKENIRLKRQLSKKFSYSNIVGNTPQMLKLFEIMHLAADSNSSVLIVGESGTGKELVANALHHNSLRVNQPYIKINCAAIPRDLLESELFGYAKGAFTGAHADKKGKFLVAHEGTLFLDEIGEMDLDLQAKLLRVLQEKEFSPLGSNRVYHVDVKIIAATNAKLEELIATKKFREDLYYRLNVIRLDIPPLRERKDDISMIAESLIKKICRNNNKKVKSLSAAAMQRLLDYSYPGNIRELENILERAVVLTNDETIGAEDLDIPKMKSVETAVENSQVSPVTAAKTAVEAPEPVFDDSFIHRWVKEKIKKSNNGEIYHEVMADVEKNLYMILLQKNFFNKSKTARMLGINRLTLEKKIQEYGVLDAWPN